MADEAKSRGNAAFSAGNFTEAITHFTDAINLSPNDHILYSNRSASHASLSNFTQSLTDAEKTVKLKPDSPEAYSRLGAAYIGLKNYSDAVSAFEKGLAIEPSNSLLKLGLTEANYALASSGYSEKQLELKNEFNVGKSIEELVRTFEEMERCFDKALLVVECAVLAKALKGVDRKKDAGVFVQKVCRLMLGNDDIDNSSGSCAVSDNTNFVNAKSLNMMGSVCLDAKDYDVSFKYLSLANRILTRLEMDESVCCDGKCVLRAVEFNQYKLHKVCLFANKLEEAVVYGKKHLEVKEKLVGEDCVELATANMDVFFALGGAANFEEAIPFGLKALEIQEKCLGSESPEAAKMRSNLSFMYRKLGQHEKALELEELAESVLKSGDSPDDMVKAGRYEEAIGVLKDNLSRDDMKEEERALDLLTMANAFYKKGNFTDARKHLRIAQEIVEKCPGLLNPSLADMLFVEMAGLYKKMDSIEAAVALMKRVLIICLLLFGLGLIGYCTAY